VTDSQGERDARAERIGLNEAIFRGVNEQLEELASRFGQPEETLDLVCECGRAECAERIRVPHAEYEAIRSDPLLFAVVPGHEQPEAEEVVRHGDEYDVVRKVAEVAASVARDTDPRA
jgi:hypothetical protein